MSFAANTPLGVVPSSRACGIGSPGIGRARVGRGEQLQQLGILDPFEVLSRLAREAGVREPLEELLRPAGHAGAVEERAQQRAPAPGRGAYEE